MNKCDLCGDLCRFKDLIYGEETYCGLTINHWAKCRNCINKNSETSLASTAQAENTNPATSQQST